MTIKGRTATVYASSKEEYESWARDAKAAGLSLSNWFSQFVRGRESNTLDIPQEWIDEAKIADLSLSQWLQEMVIKAKHKESRPNSDNNLDKQTSDIKEITKLRDQIAAKDLLLEKYRTELLKLKQSKFLEPELDGSVQFDCQMVKLLSSDRRIWTQDRLCQTLHISIEDATAMKIVSKQLHELARFGLVEETTRGWKWKR
jgi:hypothetical protein